MNSERRLPLRRCLVAVESWLLLAHFVAGCSPAAPPVPAPKNSATTEQPADSPAATERATVLVSTAASTKDVMQALIEQFADQGHADIKLNPGPSSGLANQIIEGAPADLFLSASRQWAEAVSKADLVDDSVPLLTGSLVIVVERGNPAKIAKPADLTGEAVKKIALAGESVPAGMYADQALKSLNLYDELSAAGKFVRGQDVRLALGYVEQGEAEAGIVYSTDVRASDKVESAYTFEPMTHDEIVYVLQLLKHGHGNDSARQFFDFLKSDAAADTFHRFGFERLKN